MANFCERLAAAAARGPDRPAIDMVDGDRVDTTTYAALQTLAGGYAGWLDAQGIGAGARVAILAANDARWIAAYLGILRLGAIAVPLDTAYSPAQIAAILADSGARVLFVSERLEDVARAAVATLTGASIHVAALNAAIRGAEPAPSIVVMRDDDAAAILYTSGTTADPKGVVLTHGNLEAERAAALDVIRVGADDAVLGVLPLFHALAQMTNLLLPLSAGSRVVFLATIASTSLVDALGTRGITVFACVPQFFYLIHQRVTGELDRRSGPVRWALRGVMRVNAWLRDTVRLNPGRVVFGRVHRALGPRMRYLITGGSRFDPAIARDLYGLGLTLLNGYGLTETSGAATVVRLGDRFTTSVGQPLPGVDVRIDTTSALDDEASSGAGEILIRGGIVMREYFNRPDATAEALQDGWLRTGDLGRLDAQGRVYITGRKKDVIVLSSGKNIYPEELEAHYRQSPFVREICVIGVTDASMPAAERLHAIVVPDDAALRARGTVNVRELLRFELEERSIALPPHKRILGFDLVLEPLPRTTTGKLKRGAIERLYRERAAGAEPSREPSRDESTWLADDGHRRLVATIAARLNRTSVLPDDNLELDLRLDSLERVELLAALEQQTGARVAPETRAAIFTVRQLVDAVAASGDASRLAGPAKATWDSVLAADPDPEVLRDLARPSRFRAIVMYAALQAIWLIARVGLRVRVHGRAQLPASGACLLTPNHQSYVDGMLVAASLPFEMFERIFFVGAAEYFQSRPARAIARLCNIVPVDPDAHLVNAMRAAASGLRLGKVLMLFPEGERTIDGRVRPFRKGAAILASELGVPIVPIAIRGTGLVWPRGRGLAWRALRPWRRTTVEVTYLPAMRVARGDETRATRELQETVARAVEGAAGLYHGTR